MSGDEPAERYQRQIVLPVIGSSGQTHLRRGRVCILGMGALGTQAALLLTRAGVGFLRIVDRDVPDWTNLPRQVLYDEANVRAGIPKAIAAAHHLKHLNGDVTIEPIVTDVDATSILPLIEDVDVVIDGSDNFELRYLLNDAALERGIPWIYGGAVGTHGTTMTIIPGETACLRCLFPEPPPPGLAPTCETAGVLGTVTAVIGALQASEAIKLLVGDRAASNRSLLTFDLWSLEIGRVEVPRRSDCPACVKGQRQFLNQRPLSQTVRLCGRNAVQVVLHPHPKLDLRELATRLAPLGRVEHNEYLLRFQREGYELTIFPDGRAVIRGTDDPSIARALYARYIGM